MAGSSSPLQNSHKSSSRSGTCSHGGRTKAADLSFPRPTPCSCALARARAEAARGRRPPRRQAADVRRTAPCPPPSPRSRSQNRRSRKPPPRSPRARFGDGPLVHARCRSGGVASFVPRHQSQDSTSLPARVVAARGRGPAAAGSRPHGGRALAWVGSPTRRSERALIDPPGITKCDLGRRSTRTPPQRPDPARVRHARRGNALTGALPRAQW
jgi:hypothetical protein